MPSETESMVFCSQCGQAFPPAETVTLAGAPICAACKPGYLRRLQEGALSTAPHYKGFWIRAVGLIVDGICISIVVSPFIIFLVAVPMFRIIAQRAGQPADPSMFAAMTGTIYLVDFACGLLGLAYNTLMLGRFGATLGDMAIGAKVVTPEGNRIGYGRALARSLMKLISGFILCIGYLMAAFDSKKRTLHDRVAGTVVIAKA